MVYSTMVRSNIPVHGTLDHGKVEYTSIWYIRPWQGRIYCNRVYSILVIENWLSEVEFTSKEDIEFFPPPGMNCNIYNMAELPVFEI